MRQTLPQEPLLLTLDQASDLCQVSRAKIDEWSHRTGFPVIREGGVVRVPLDLFKVWLEGWARGSNEREPVDRMAIVPTAKSYR